MKLSFSILIILLFISTQAFGIGIKTPSGINGLADLVYTNGWALIIGVKDYTPSSFQRPYAESDVDAVSEVLTSKYGFNKEHIITLKNENATKKNIMASIESLAEPKKVSIEDCLLIYFCGQGVTFTNEKGDYGFLVPYNTDFDLSKEYSYDDYKANCMSVYSLQIALRFVLARHILIVVDGCSGGVLIRSIRKTGSEISDPILRASACKGFLVLIAGQKGEKPIDDHDTKSSVFTYNFIKALDEYLADENKDGLITGSELASYLGEMLSKATDGKQKTKFIKAGDGDFLFAPQLEKPKEK
ncbi:TPA: caspase family protein [bacterium]|nr:caspase family protein [bacterium]